MTEYESLLDQVQNLLAEPAPDIVELRSQLLDIEDFIGAPDYAELDSDQQDALQNLRKALKARLRDLEDAQPETVEEGNVEAGSPSPTAIKDDLPPLSARKISAEEQMEEAEKFFYSGRYGEAIKLFDRVLDLEPDWRQRPPASRRVRRIPAHGLYPRSCPASRSRDRIRQSPICPRASDVIAMR